MIKKRVKMPYATFCIVEPDDGKIHDPRKIGNVDKSVCGKLIKKLIRSGEGGKWHTMQHCCLECWPCLKEKNQLPND